MYDIKENDVLSSVVTNASDKGKAKCFLIILRYVHFDESVQYACEALTAFCMKFNRIHYNSEV